MDLRTAQDLIMKNKRDKGFNLSNVPHELCLLQGELADFFDAWRHKRDNAGEELADVTVHVLAPAAMTDTDLATELRNKVEKNARRTYVRDSTGTLVKHALDDTGEWRPCQPPRRHI